MSACFFRGGYEDEDEKKNKTENASIQDFILMGGWIKRGMLLHRTGKGKETVLG